MSLQRKHRDRGYASKQRRSLTERHASHTQKVTACPSCNPKGWVAKDVAMPARRVYPADY